jgi:SPP1 family predicted phage head-tail adaptor
MTSVKGPKIGEMYHRITLRTTTSATKNGLGHAATVTNTDVALQAAIRYQDLPENDLLGKQTYIQHIFFTIHFRTVTTSQKIIFEGNTYDIISVNPFISGKSRFTVIKTKRVI